MQVQTDGPPSARPVLLLHGGGVAGWMWTALRQSLRGSYSVLIPDLPGHGGSAEVPYRSTAEIISELGELISGEAGRPAAVIGFSRGGQLAIELAARHPELVDRVMIISAQARPMRSTKLTLALLRLSTPLARRRWFARLQARQLFIPDELLEDYVRTSTRISADALLAVVDDNLRYRLPAAWSDFPGDALVLVGSRERKLMRDSADAIHAALPGSGLEVIEGAGHGIPLQRSDWFDQRVRRWLADR